MIEIACDEIVSSGAVIIEAHTRGVKFYRGTRRGAAARQIALSSTFKEEATVTSAYLPYNTRVMIVAIS
jgi:hypothetical protein